MRFLTLLLFSLSPFAIKAQCAELTLATLQGIQRAEPSQKDAHIQSLGFDPVSQQKDKVTYHKCWRNSETGKVVYEQKIFWDQTESVVTFLTLNRDHFFNLRRSIEERHGGNSTKDVNGVYIGRLFEYHFGLVSNDGHEYYKVSIAFKKG